MVNKFKLRERGDTIVEVMIALAILTLVLWGAYYTANQSYRNDRDSQEHTEATTVAETQVEGLKSLGANFNPVNDQCINNDLVATIDCEVDGSNTSNFYLNASSCLSYCYTVKDVAEPTTTPFTLSVAPPVVIQLTTYKVNVSWFALGGGTDQVTLYYRVQ